MEKEPAMGSGGEGAGLEPGLEATVEAVVDAAMTAASLGSGDVEVLGTPAVLALAERAACKAIEGRLPPGQTSVGSRVGLSHSAPTLLGAEVRATARLVEVVGRTLRFEIEVTDPGGTVGTARLERVMVDRGRFLDTAEER